MLWNSDNDKHKILSSHGSQRMDITKCVDQNLFIIHDCYIKYYIILHWSFYFCKLLQLCISSKKVLLIVPICVHVYKYK